MTADDQTNWLHSLLQHEAHAHSRITPLDKRSTAFEVDTQLLGNRTDINGASPTAITSCIKGVAAFPLRSLSCLADQRVNCMRQTGALEFEQVKYWPGRRTKPEITLSNRLGRG